MNILIIGSGGREHAIGLALSRSAKKPTLFFAPGNAGTEIIGKNLPVSDSDIPALIKVAKNYNVSLTIVGPEIPLVMGIVDAFEDENLAIIGPNKEAAQLEGSKQWAKDLMQRHHIPTATFETFSSYEASSDYIKSQNTYPIVIKADGLAAGKGVTIATTEEEALSALTECFIDQKFKDAGSTVIVESFLKGDEASLFAFTDSNTILPMLPAQDHKAIFDGDKGPNTGGMGAYCPTPLITPQLQEKIIQTIFEPLLNAFKKEGIKYKGIIYAGLMIGPNDDVFIVEFNARFGDPETQVVLPLLKTDLIDVFQAIIDENLSSINLTWSSDSAVCVVVASGGYPDTYEKGKPIQGLQTVSGKTHIIHAGTTSKQNEVLTSGGRVLGVITQDQNLETAISTTYKAIDSISFEKMYYRRDIGQKASRYIKTNLN